MEQMWGAIGAVFGSWKNDRAIVYRRQYGYPARLGHGRQHLLDGVRQHGRRLRHRRRLHARPGHRREGLLRRVPHQRPGRGRGRRHPHAQEDRRAAEGHARRLQAARRDPQQAREALPRRAGHRVHHPEGQALDAANAQRQAHRLRGRALRRRHGRRKGSSRKEEALSARPHSAGRSEPAAAADLRPGGQAQGHRRRHGCWPRASTPAPARRPAGSSSSPTTPRPGSTSTARARRMAGSSWSAAKPARRTSAACRRPTAS